MDADWQARGEKAPSVQPPSTREIPSSKQPRLVDGVVGSEARVAGDTLRLVPPERDTAAAHFLETVSRQRVRSSTPVYTRLHRLAPLGTGLHLLF